MRKSHIDPFLDQVDTAVVEDRFDRELGMRREEKRQPRNNVESAECYARAEAQPARKTGARVARRGLHLVCLLDRALGARVKVLAYLGRGEPTRRPEARLTPRRSSS
jgi:hypothetical protein